MGIYFGTEKKSKINIGETTYYLLFPFNPIGLVSSDNFTLKDIDGVYILPRRENDE